MTQILNHPNLESYNQLYNINKINIFNNILMLIMILSELGVILHSQGKLQRIIS